jgi:hypothetical protein
LIARPFPPSYNIGDRRIEYDLLPWCEQHGMPVMVSLPKTLSKLARGLRARLGPKRRRAPVLLKIEEIDESLQAVTINIGVPPPVELYSRRFTYGLQATTSIDHPRRSLIEL